VLPDLTLEVYQVLNRRSSGRNVANEAAMMARPVSTVAQIPKNTTRSGDTD
jgi:hypothetical protein